MFLNIGMKNIITSSKFMENKQERFFQQITKNLPDIDDSRLIPYLQKTASVKESLTEQIKNKQIPPLNILEKQNDLEIEEINNIAAGIINNFKQVVILGVGGSSLGGKTLAAVKNNPRIKIDFLESIDSNTIKSSLDKIDLKNSCFVVISKSGETVETICQTLIIIEKLKNYAVKNLADHFLFITRDQKNTIAKIAAKIGSRVYHHPADIGGRFSYLTIVGLLPAALVGLDISAIREAAKEILNNFITQKTPENEIAKICALQLYLFDRGFVNNVIMPYIDNLKNFTDWYRQLWAESLGKNGFGSTPINSMGTIDQHSQLQLYLDGPKDKFFTFITDKGRQCDFKINDLENCKTGFGGKNLSDILTIEQNTTIEILRQQKLPIRILEINTVNEATLSALMMRMFLETIIIARAKNINPFDQPAVEMRKNLAKKILAEK